MLTLSENAAHLLAESRSQQGIPDDATLRVAPAEGAQEQGLSLGFVAAPFDGDHTGHTRGMPICVAPEVAEALDTAQIDVETSGETPQLVLVPAP